jgi:hypothetical protein
MMQTIEELKRAVDYGTERGHGTLIVPIPLLRKLLNPSPPVIRTAAPCVCPVCGTDGHCECY